jgi:hypothetical protein
MSNVLYFGAQWDAPILGGATQVATPVGQSCLNCGELIEAGDRGLLRPYLSAPQHDGRPEASVEPVHLECELRAIMGHEVGVCPCHGYGSSRLDARLVLQRVNVLRAADQLGSL